MKYFTCLLILFSFFSGNIFAQDWSLVWQDEFSGNILDDSKWTQEIGTGSQYGLWGWGNSELQYYQPENSIVSDGTLKIIAKEESVGGMNYTSSRIKTDGKFSFHYGKVQARMKTVDGQGFWPAFWMLPTGGSWPCDGEIDIMEQWGIDGATDQTTGAAHVGDCPGGSTYDSFHHTISSGSYADDFHIYEVQWFEDYIAWYVDDVKVYEMSPQTFPNNNWAFNDNDWYILLNFAISNSGPNDNTAFPSQVEVDWVRVFEDNENSGCTDPTAHNFNSSTTIDIGNCLYQVNFELNLNCEDFIPGSINITGPNDDWSCINGTSLTDSDGDGIWTASSYLPLGDFEYVYCGDGWGQSEDFLTYGMVTGDWSCSPITDYSTYANRRHTVEGPAIISEVWSSCGECNELVNNTGCTDIAAINFNANALTEDGTCEYIAEQLQITVDVCSSANEVKMTGPSWSWNPNTGPLAEDNGDGTWTFTFSPTPTENMEFLIVVDGIQENLIPGNTTADNWSCTPVTDYYSYANRLWVEGSGHMSIVYGTCNNYCEGIDDTMANVEFFVDMNEVDYPSNDYDNVVVNGSWNGWNGWGIQLSDENGDGIYTGILEVEPNSIFEYVVAVTGPADDWSGWGLQWGDGCLGYNVVVSPGGVGSLTNTYLSAGCELVQIIGCTDVNAENYNVSATLNEIDQNGNLLCVYSSCDNSPENGCIYSGGFGFFNSFFDAVLCVGYGGIPCEDSYETIEGCTDTSAFNYDFLANTDDGSCNYQCIPPWEVIVTDQNHSIFITSSWLDQDGNELNSEFYLGVFYQNSDGEMACAGYSAVMDGTEQIAVMGDDSSSIEVDGLSSGQPLEYIIWDSNACEEFIASVSYSSGPNLYTSNGISFVSQVQISEGEPSQQNITFPSGWSLFSTYISPENTDISIILEDVVEDIIIVKNNMGAAYLTEWNFNGIGILLDGQGYQIKTSEIIYFVIDGVFTSPESTSISLLEGWNMVGYLRTTGSPADLVLADLVDDEVIIIAKDYNGSAYLPEYSFNGIGDMFPGQGYQIKTNQSGTLQYLSDGESY